MSLRSAILLYLLYVFLVLILPWYFCAKPVSAGKHFEHEATYSKAWCDSQFGFNEVKLFDNSRVDCLLDVYAIETDFADKAWKEGIGQALWYALVTRRNPGVLVIVETADDCRYVKRVHAIARWTHPTIHVWETGPAAGTCQMSDGDLE